MTFIMRRFAFVGVVEAHRSPRLERAPRNSSEYVLSVCHAAPVENAGRLL